jgi:RNA polymerase sigma factor (sigma-70 family)
VVHVSSSWCGVTGWEGGYGNALSPEEVIDRLYRASRHQVAKWHSPDDHLFDDLVQEGVVAGLKAAAKAEGDPVTYGAVSARRRITDVATGSPMLGSAEGASRHEVTRRPAMRESDEALDDLLLAAPDLLEAVEWSYHRGTILAVLSGLSERHREYVYMRFWLGLPDSEIAARRGTTREAEKSLWNRTIKPTLRRELAHLR